MLGLGRSFQDARLFPSLTVRETIAIALERHIKHARTRSPPRSCSPATQGLASEQVAERGRRAHRADAPAAPSPTSSSASCRPARRRIVDLACSLAHRPSVLLLDEPSSGIAQRETEALGPVLLDIRDHTGAALIVIEHDMPLIQGDLRPPGRPRARRGGRRGATARGHRPPAGRRGSYLGGTDAVINRSGGAS